MGEVLGIGCTHIGVGAQPERMADNYLRKNLAHPTTPAHLRDSKNWPTEMQTEWADDEGLEVAKKYKFTLEDGFRKARERIDEFNPDFVLIWGDDQYENITEDLIPPFTVFAIEDEILCPPESGRTIEARISGHKEGGDHIVHELIKSGFEVACSWRLPHHHGYGHAIGNTVAFLDYAKRDGFPYKVVPFAVNCYGVNLRVPNPKTPVVDQKVGRIIEHDVPPPPAPQPWRCYDMGKRVREIIEASPWRAVVIGSSSWSHASLTAKHHFLWPDMEADDARFEELIEGEQWKWRDLSAEQIVDSGQHEFLNWVCLAGAMEGRQVEIISRSRAWLFNSSRTVCVFEPESVASRK